jgi:hypothetical protein
MQIIIEIPDGQASAAVEAFTAAGFKDEEGEAVGAGVKRALEQQVAVVTVNRVRSLAAQAAAKSAADAAAEAFGTTVEALTPQVGGGPGRNRQ